MEQLVEPAGGTPPRVPPFGLDLSLAVFDRATRLAKSLFTAADASIILVHRGEVWRSRHAATLPADDPISEAVMASGELFWVEDGCTDARVKNNPLVTGPPYLRFCAAMPIQLADGSRPGVLSVSGLQPQAFDAAKAARLKDLADFLADEWVRAHFVRERDAALARSERSEERLNLALSLADLHVWELDFRRKELTKAGAEASFFDRNHTYEALCQDTFITIDQRDRPAVEAAWKAHEETGAPYRPEFRVARDDGAEVWVESTSRLFADERGRPTRLVGALQNITARKRAEDALRTAKEEAEAANRAKSTFLATMSHEIRTPLNGVLGMAQVIAADVLTPEQRDRIEVVRQSGEALLGVLNDVLDISKIEAGKVELEMIDFDLRAITRSLNGNFTSLADGKGVALTFEVDAAEGLYRGDPTRLRQILNNLIANALKFTDAGEVRVAVAHSDGWLTVTVSDSGIGMTAHSLQSLFDPFHQADSTTTRRFGGTGLGLAICRDLAGLMGGSIEVDSAPDRGSTFTVAIPLAWVGAPVADMVEADSSSTGRPWMGQMRILAAEDNAVNRLVLKTLLQQAGAEPVMVANGAEAVEAWKAQAWDAILMDVQMPVMDGPAATLAIRRLEAEADRAHTPIIGLTANAMTHQIAEYLMGGMDHVVTKPIDVRKLFDALEAMVGGAGEVQRVAV
jgi:signal transduction histidine kinase/ActR/RegA family two-component response regulator